MGLKIEKWYFIYQYKNAIVSFWFNIPATPAKNYQNDNFYTYNGIAINLYLKHHVKYFITTNLMNTYYDAI